MTDLLTLDEGTMLIQRPADEPPLELARPTPFMRQEQPSTESVAITAPSSITVAWPIAETVGPCTVALRMTPRDPERQLVAYLASIAELSPRGFVVRPAEPSVSESLEILRVRAALTMSELADVLSVSRRSVYTWSDRGALSRENQRRLTGIVHAIEPLLDSWAPADVRVWLKHSDTDIRDLVRHGEFDEVRRLALDALGPQEIPLRQARPVTQVLSEVENEIQVLDTEARVAYLNAFSGGRRRAEIVEWQPREVTGMGDDDDE
jgi:hypothetical protein